MKTRGKSIKNKAMELGYNNKLQGGYNTKDLSIPDGADIIAEFAPVFRMDNKLVGMKGMEEGYYKIKSLGVNVANGLVLKAAFIVYGGLGYILNFAIKNSIPIGVDDLLGGYEVEAMGGEKLFIDPFRDGKIKIVKYECGTKRLVEI